MKKDDIEIYETTKRAAGTFAAVLELLGKKSYPWLSAIVERHGLYIYFFYPLRRQDGNLERNDDHLELATTARWSSMEFTSWNHLVGGLFGLRRRILMMVCWKEDACAHGGLQHHSERTSFLFFGSYLLWFCCWHVAIFSPGVPLTWSNARIGHDSLASCEACDSCI